MVCHCVGRRSKRDIVEISVSINLKLMTGFNGNTRQAKRLPLRCCVLLVFFWSVIANSQATSVEQNGIRVDFSLSPLLADGNRGPRDLKSRSDAQFSFHIADVNGAPILGAYPAAWMERRSETIPTGRTSCLKKVKTFIENSFFSQPSLNLNVYYVLVMNDDASISVVDPLFHFGGSNLLTMISLSSPGYDWQRSNLHNRLFVSLPEATRLAIIDTVSFKVIEELALAVVPGHVALQPDQQYVWVGYEASLDSDDKSGDKDRQPGGVLVINVKTGEIAADITTGPGEHEIAFSADNHYAFISNAAGNSVSVVDIRRLQKVKDIVTGIEPVSMDYSEAANTVYVAHRGDGVVIAINAESLEVKSRTLSAPGLAQMRFAPGGRFALLVNTSTDEVSVFDAVTATITKTGKVESGPDQVTFSETLAYIRHSNSETVLMFTMDVIADAKLSLQAADFPGGQSAFGLATSPAVNIVQAPGENAVLVAHPGDQQIYYYKEGMAAPMGGFKNYQRSARAVMAIDRTLQETQPGYYETVARLTEPGTYDVAFFLESPRVVHCFNARIMPADRDTLRDIHGIAIELLPFDAMQAQKKHKVRFRLRDTSTGKLYTELDDLQALIVLSPGIWRQQQKIKNVSEGVYSLAFSPPRKGAYTVQLRGDWEAINSSTPQNMMFRVH